VSQSSKPALGGIMTDPLKLMLVFAHPDDETLGSGGTAAKYAAEGVEVSLVTATRGERGWAGPEAENPGLEALGRLRTAELQAAAQILGIHEVSFLDYIDGDLDKANALEAVGKIVSPIRRVRPQVVVTFGPDGTYGHPDHIAINQFTQAALVCAADPGFGSGSAHRVSKLYYMVDSQVMVDNLKTLGIEISMEIDGVERHHVGWDAWAISASLDATAYFDQVWQAIQCHQTQLPTMGPIETAPRDTLRAIFGSQTYYRAYSLVNSGRAVEHDLFEGLR
jgi:LmbE family N-acetylglucosaminyl deacetylase